MQQNSLMFYQPSDALPPPVNPIRDYRGVLSNLENKDSFNQSVYALPYTTRGTFLPFGRNERGIGLAVPQALLDMYNATIPTVGKALSGQLGVPSINNPVFTGAVTDMGANIAGGSLIGKSIPKAVPENSLGIFGGTMARFFPAKKMLNEIDEKSFIEPEIKLKKVENELTKGRFALGDKKTNELQAEKANLIKQADNARLKALKEKQNYLIELDKYMQSQDYRKGMPNQDARFFASKRKFGTGLFQMPDGKYRFEIDDTQASLKNLPSPTNYRNAVELTADNFPNLKKIDILKMALPSKPLNTILKHDELFKNYPQLNNTRVAFVDDYPYLGGFYPKENFIIVNSGKIAKDFGEEKAKDRIMSTLLHEIQHNVQEIENFTRGGGNSGIQNVRLNLQDASRKKDEAYLGYSKYTKANQELAKVNKALRLIDLNKKSIEGSQPKFLFNQMDWYIHGDKIRREVTEELGYSYPIRKSPKRDEWQKRAYRKLYLINRNQSWDVPDELLNQTPRELKNYSKRLERVLDNNLKDKLIYDSQDKRTQALFRMAQSGETESLSYFNKLGEVEARIVQARSGFDPDFKDKMYRPENPYKNLQEGLFAVSKPEDMNIFRLDDTEIDMFERGQGLLTRD